MTTPSPSPASAVAAPRMVLGVPAYFRPGSSWAVAAAGAPTVRYLIVNPSSGPGSSPEAAYASTVETTRAAGIDVMGYVSTRWARRPSADVQNDIAAYRDWYGVHSIFLDEAASSPTELPYYRALAKAVRGGGRGTLALNPGTVPHEGYARLADLLVVFEGPYAAYRTWQPPTWQDRYPRSRFWHLVYATPPDSAMAALRAADRRTAGVVHVTDGVLDNPWGSLPSYWRSAVTTVQGRAGSRHHQPAGADPAT